MGCVIVEDNISIVKSEQCLKPGVRAICQDTTCSRYCTDKTAAIFAEAGARLERMTDETKELLANIFQGIADIKAQREFLSVNEKVALAALEHAQKCDCPVKEIAINKTLISLCLIDFLSNHKPMAIRAEAAPISGPEALKEVLQREMLSRGILPEPLSQEAKTELDRILAEANLKKEDPDSGSGVVQ